MNAHVTKLLPCPFCGGKAQLKTCRGGADSELAWVECVGCEAETCRFEDAYAPTEQAVSEWNRRVSTPVADAAGWRTMDSAPKDGTEILVVGPSTDGGFYRDTQRWPDGWRGEKWPVEFMGFAAGAPTHWQPLPPPPESGT